MIGCTEILGLIKGIYFSFLFIIFICPQGYDLNPVNIFNYQSQSKDKGNYIKNTL